MAWSGVANNQMVSFTDAQTSPFPLKSGQSHVTSNQCMTRLEITNKYVTVLGFADNQLVPKSYWSCYSLPDIGFGIAGYEACYNSNNGILILAYANASTLEAATAMYLSCASRSAATSGWYSNGIIARYWDSTAFIDTIYTCVI